MSQLLDSLRKAHRTGPASAAPAAGPRTAVVVNSLGLTPRRKRRIPSPGVVVAVLFASGSVAAGALVWRPAPITTGEANQALGDFARALAFQRAGEIARAIAIYEALLARDQLPAEAHNNLGLIRQDRGKLEDAAREFENSLAHDPGYAPAHYNLAVLYDRAGDRARAGEHYRAFLEHRGNDHASLTPDVTGRLAALDEAR